METAKPDILDSLIYVSIVLFILSVIVEKITQLVRYYPSHFRHLAIISIVGFYGISIYSYATGTTCDDIQLWDLVILLLFNTALLILFFVNLSWVRTDTGRLGTFARKIVLLENVRKGITDSQEEKERDITFLSFIIGFVIAYLFNAHLIKLFITPGAKLGWGDVDPFINTFRMNRGFFGFDLYNAIGFAMTGFFLSFGSKFFHDILDTLFQAKELKRKMNDNETYRASTIEEFKAQLGMSDKDMVKTTFNKHVDNLMKIEGVLGVSCGDIAYKGTTAYGIKIYSNKESILLPALAYEMPNGNSRAIPIQIVHQKKAAKICSVINPSDTARNKTQNTVGSICFAVKDKDYPDEKYLLTCYHVVKGGAHSWNYYTQQHNEQDKVVIQINEPGEIRRGVRNREMDAALIVPDAGWSFKNSVPDFTTPIKSARPVYYSDDDKTPVNIFGARTKEKKSGTITGVGSRHKIDFGDGTAPFEMVNLIEIQSNGGTIVLQGDSGSLVFTDGGEALGMVFASTEHVTLAIPIYTIFQNWNIELDI